MADIILNDQILSVFLNWVGQTIFIWLPVLLFYIFRSVWRDYIRAAFLARKKYVLFEIKVPRDIAKSPKAMESFLASLHGTRRMGNALERWWDGWITAWFSLEIVGDATGVRFYIRTEEFFKRMIENQIYAQYPSSEVRVVEDYTKDLPSALPDENWRVWGSEFVLTKPDAYPIRTYEEFTLEGISSKEEERKVDPLAGLVEHLGHLKGSERFWIQILTQPSSDKWKKEGEALVGKLIGKKVSSKSTLLENIVWSIDSAISDFLGMGPEKPERKQDAPPSQMLFLSPGERVVVEAVEENIAKIGFDICIRWLYVVRREDFDYLNVPAIMGIFKQFSSQSLNGFKLNGKITTSVDYWFEKTRIRRRAIRLYNAYRLRSVFHPPYKKGSKTFVLSSSELATIYHFPGMVVSSSGMERVEAKRGAPPPNLPI